MTLQEKFTPLRDDEPSEAEISGVVAAAAHPARPERWRRRTLMAVAGTTAAAALALAALPSQDAPPRVASSPEAPEPEAPGSGPSILRAAAAVAAEQPASGPFEGYRYTRWRETWAYTIADRQASYEQDTELWLDAEYKGRRVTHAPENLQGDRGMALRLADGHSERPYEYGDGPRAKIEELPTEPRALRDALMDSYRRHMAPNRPADDEHYDLVRRVLLLLGAPSTTPALRAGLFGVLAETDGVQPAPEARDALGRSGRSVTIPTRRKEGVFTIIFDPDDSEMLFWSEIGSGGGTPDQTHTLVRTAQVDAMGERP